MASWKNRPARRGLTWCGDCRKWKAHKAFVRSHAKRGTKMWVREGYVWKKFKTCNRCSRVYHHKGMSAADFVREFGAEEHNDSEAESLIDEDEAFDIKDEDVKDEDVKDEDVKDEDIKDEAIKNEGIKNEDIKTEGDETKHTHKRIKLDFTQIKTEDNDEKADIKRVKVERVKIEGVEDEGFKLEEVKLEGVIVEGVRVRADEAGVHERWKDPVNRKILAGVVWVALHSRCYRGFFDRWPEGWPRDFT